MSAKSKAKHCAGSRRSGATPTAGTEQRQQEATAQSRIVGERGYSVRALLFVSMQGSNTRTTAQSRYPRLVAKGTKNKSKKFMRM